MKFTLTKNTSNSLKIISALVIVLHHYAQYVCLNHLSDSIFYKVLSAQGGFIGVAIFFFLSGYGLMESEQRSHLNPTEFLKRRFFKIYLPVLLVTIIWMFAVPFLLSESPFEGFKVEIGGGKYLIFSNILYRFGDGVLWFIRVLFLLYAMFFVFSLLWKKHFALSITVLGILTIAISALVSHMFAPFESISIPFFPLGVFISLYKENRLCIVFSIVGLILYALIEYIFIDYALALHSIINIIGLIFLILVLFIWTIDIKLPELLTIISFDLYLVHNKVLMVMEGNTLCNVLWVFMTVVFITTACFSLLRIKLLKI